MSILSEINDALNTNPIFRRGTNEVRYFHGNGWDMLVSTYIGQPGKHLVTPRATLDTYPTATLYVSIGSTEQNVALKFDAPGIHVRLGQTLQVATRNGPLVLEPSDRYGECLHGRWVLTAHRGMVLRVMGIAN